MRTVVAPDGRTWKVRRKWVTRTVRWRSLDASHAPDPVSALPVDDDIGCLPAVGIAVGVFAIGVAAIFLVLPALVFVVELAVVVLLVALGALARIVFRRPWTVEARVAGTNEGRQWKVTGWRASGQQVETVAERLRSTGRVGDVTWTPSPTD